MSALTKNKEHSNFARNGEQNGMFGRNHSIESIEKMRLAKLGKKASLDTRMKMRESSNPNNPGRFNKGITPWNKGLNIDDERVKKNIESSINTKLKNNILRLFGKNNPNWKGGVNSLNNNIRKSDKMSQYNSEILKRDDYKCVICDENNNKLEVHHKKPLHKILKDNNIIDTEDSYKCEELWDLNNAITVCYDCHCKIDSFRVKGGKK